MAIADVSLRVVTEAGLIERVTMPVAVNVGDLIGIGAGAYRLSADTHQEYPAVAIALEKCAAGEKCAIARYGKVSGFTGGTVGLPLVMYDAGKYRDAIGGLHWAQIVGFTLSATEGWVDLRPGSTDALLAGQLLSGASLAPLATVLGSQIAAHARQRTMRSRNFDIDIGAAATLDDCIMIPASALTLTAARFVYTEATAAAGVTAGSIQVGSTVAGAELCAAVNFTQPKAVGTTEAVAITSAVAAANTMITARLTGVVATPIVGQGFIEIDYTVDD